MFTLYKASAGSGKTFRLVVEYLTLCLPQPEKFSSVLAITFTNNATAEMKSRIVQTLSQLAFEEENDTHSKISPTYNQLVGRIAKEMPENEQATYIKKQSKILLQKILYEYDRFSISTIDAFFQRILRAFALEFGLNAQFNLEIETNDFFSETISVLLHRISKNDEALTQRVLDLVKNTMLEKGKWKIEREILRLLNFSFKEEVQLPLKKLQESENKNFEVAKKRILQEKRRIEALLKNFNTRKEKKSEEYLLLKEQEKEVDFFGKNLFQLSLLFDLKIIMDEIKAQDQCFFISETNAKINEKLEEEDVPFIYEKIGNQYSYFFIDEFQDTSQLQWQNMISLIKNALSGNNRFNEQGKLFLFGDVKQAIYRFRNGDADILQKLSKIEGYKDTVLSYAEHNKDYRVEGLDTNFRSSKKVVAFNNAFFEFLTAESGPFAEARDFYEDVRQKTKPSAEEGSVTVCFQEEEDERKFEEFMPEQVLATTFDALQRGYSCKDIAVLFSSNNRVREVAAHLVAHNLPIISADSLKLNASQEVSVIIAVLQYLISADDKVAKLTIIHYFIQQNNLSYEDYIECVQNEEAFQQFLKLLHVFIYRNQLLPLPLLTLVNEICRIFSFSRNDPFLMRFLDETEAFATQRNGDLSLFLNWWEGEGSQKTISTPQGMNAITISTIHKAKGLEYPVVILPLNRYSYFKTKPDIFVQDQVTGLEYDWVTLTNEAPERYQPHNEAESKKTAIDNLNKLYVAHTRASKELHIITEKRGKGNYSKYLDAFYSNEIHVRREGLQAPHHLPHTTSPTLPVTRYSSPVTAIPTHPQYTPLQLRGIFIHNFLSSLAEFPQNEAEIAITVQNVDEKYREDLVHVFHNIMNDKLLAPCFAPQVKVLNETSILFPNGNLLRPDRVVFLEGRVVVIDYKTGESHASHQEQMEQYCNAIREMGYSNVEGKVLYV